MVATGPVQSGKTLAAFVIPTMYHLFEIGETVIVGLPSMDMAADKWKKDFAPAIEASRYRDLIPKSGTGSRGGTFTSMTFANGATLRFMSGGGGDKKRAGYTARVVVITETDGMDEAGEVSREADKITQLEARTESYGEQSRIYMECTVSIERGRTWQEYTQGTRSRIVVRCRACDAWVTPEREHLVLWQDADNKLAAKAAARFACPSCGVTWSDDDRRVANEGALLVHRGQEVTPDGVIVGPAPETDTLGFRWSAFNNLFQKTGDFGAKEWGAVKSADPDNSEKALRQFTWCLPVEADTKDSVPLDQDVICRRRSKTGRGKVPDGTDCITVGVDVGDHVGWYVAIAWQDNANGVIIDYGAFDISSRDLTPPVAILSALRGRYDVFEAGWDGRQPDAVWVDSGHEHKAVYTFTREAGKRYRPTKGHGVRQERMTAYDSPRKLARDTPVIGDGWHVAYQAADQIWLIHVNSDHWKTRAHQYLTAQAGHGGSLVLFDAPPQEHLTFARHVTAERKVDEFVPGKGTVTRWVRDRRQNHYLDCLHQAIAAADHLGVKPTEASAIRSTPQPKQFSKQKAAALTMPDGRPFLITERE